MVDDTTMLVHRPQSSNMDKLIFTLLFSTFILSCSDRNSALIYNALTPGLLSPIGENEESIRNDFNAVLINNPIQLDSIQKHVDELGISPCGDDCSSGEPLLICDLDQGFFNSKTIVYDGFSLKVNGSYYCTDTVLVKMLFRLSKGSSLPYSFGDDEHCN
jgi:hypothetical protein